MQRRFYLLLTALFLSAAITTQAQNQKPLSLDDAVKMGMDYSKTLKISQARLAAARARVSEMKSLYVPNVGVSANYTRISDNIEPLTLNFPNLGEFTLNPQILNQFYNKASLNYTVFAGLRGTYTLKSMQYLEKATEEDVNKDASDTRLNIVNAYLNYYKTLQSKTALDTNLRLYQTRLRDVTNFAAQGLVLQNDVLRAQLGVSTLETNQAEMQSAIDVSNYNLDLMLGLPTTTVIVPTDTALVVANVPTLDAAFQSAGQNRAEIKAAENRLQSADASLKTSRGAYLPTLSVFGNYYYNDPNQRVFPPEDKFKDTWDAGVTLSWSLSGLYTNRYNVQEAAANYAQAQVVTEQLSDAVKMDVNSSYSAYALAKQKITLAQQSLAQATENQRVLQNRYNNATATYSDLEEADAMRLQAELNLINAKTDATAAYYKLQKSIGIQ